MTPPDAASAPLPAARRLRRAWLGVAAIALTSTLMPWSCKSSAVGFAVGWTWDSDAGWRLLGLSLLLPIVVLLAALLIEVSKRLPGRGTLLLLAAHAFIGLLILALSDVLPEPNESVSPGAIFRLSLPRPLALHKGAGQTLLRLLLLAPVVAVAAWAAIARSLAPMGVRWIAGYTAAAVALTWAPACEGLGFWIGIVATSATAVLASLVPPAAGPTARRALALATAACLLAIVAIVLPLRFPSEPASAPATLLQHP